MPYAEMSLDINRKRLLPNMRIRLRNGVYAGYYARVLEVNGRRVKVRVPAEVPATLTVSSITCEVVETGRDG